MESLTGTCRLTFLLYARFVLPVMFLLQAFMITYLFDSDTEQSTDGLYFLMEPMRTLPVPILDEKKLS